MKKSEILQIVGFFLLWTMFLQLIMHLSPIFLVFQASFPYAGELLKYNLPSSLTALANFDGVHYLTIANSGYFGIGLIQAFFPLFPLLMRFAHLLIDNLLLAGVLLSQLFALSSMLSFYYLLKIYYGKKIAWRGLLVMAFFVSAFYLRAIYNEGLFLTLIFGTWIAAKKGHFTYAGIFAALASATRIVGIGLWPSLLLFVWLHQRHNYKAYLQVSLSAFGLLAYMAYLYVHFDDPLYFFSVQSQFGAGRQTNLILWPQVIWRYLKIFYTVRPFNLKYYTYVQEFILSVLGLLALVHLTWQAWQRKRKNSDSSSIVEWPHLLFSLIAYFLPTMTGNFSSMPRYLLVCFILFIYVSRLKKSWFFLYLTSSLILLIINLILFTQGYWVA